jgi:hypothetical protein
LTEEQRQHRAKVTEAELALARHQELLDAYDLVLLDLKNDPGLHGHLPSLRSMKAETVRKIAAHLAKLKATAPP